MLNFKPTSPGIRHRRIVKSLPRPSFFFKRKLLLGFKKHSGRNHSGRITSFCRGGGHKRLFRLVDHSHLLGSYSLSKVIRIEYNPYGSSHIALFQILDSSTFFYRLATESLQVGAIIEGAFYKNALLHLSSHTPSSDDHKDILGSTNVLKHMYQGTKIHDLTLYSPKDLQKNPFYLKDNKSFSTPSNNFSSSDNLSFDTASSLNFPLSHKDNSDYLSSPLFDNNRLSPLSRSFQGKVARAAGTECIVQRHISDSLTLVLFPSKQVQLLSSDCTAIIGTTSNAIKKFTRLGKAGASR